MAGGAPARYAVAVRTPVFVVALLLGLGIAADVPAQEDFDPSGRRARPQGGRKKKKDDDDNDGEKKPNTDKLIKRYTGILLKSPAEQFPLQKLTELYRKRDGNIDKLVEDFEARAAADDAEQFNA